MLQLKQHLTKSVKLVDVSKVNHLALKEFLTGRHSFHLVQKLHRLDGPLAERIQLIKQTLQLFPIPLLHTALLLNLILQIIIRPRLRINQEQLQELFLSQPVRVLMRRATHNIL